MSRKKEKANSAFFICQFTLYRRTIFQIVRNSLQNCSAGQKKCEPFSVFMKDVANSGANRINGLNSSIKIITEKFILNDEEDSRDSPA